MIGNYKEPNMYVTFNPKDEDKVRKAMSSIYQFREKGHHSDRSNLTQVDYWEIFVPGLCNVYTLAAERLVKWDFTENKRVRQCTLKVWQIFEKLNDMGIDYNVRLNVKE